MISPSVSDNPGFYGKLPVQGDFVSRRLPASFIQTWDGWLQSLMAFSKESLGNGWVNAYLAGPKLRFALSPNIFDNNSWAGILVPSVDKVGRYFPLTVGMCIDKPEKLFRFFIFEAEWFDRLEKITEAALQDRLSMDEFDRQLTMQSLRSIDPANEDISFKHVQLNDGNYGWHFDMINLKQLPDVCIQLSEKMLSAYLPEYTIWCSTGANMARSSFQIYAGLPPKDFYSELLARHYLNDHSRPSTEHNVLSRVPGFEELQEIRQEENSSIGTPVNWISSACTTVGTVREINEDAFLESPENGLWAVADGMGGHSAGDVASRTAVQALGNLSGSDNIEAFVNDVTECLQRVNAELIEKAEGPRSEQIIGSTIVAMLAAGNRCASIWAGDSRLYRYRDGVLKQLTYDHTSPVKVSIADFFDDGVPAGGDHNNAICKALGAIPDLQVDVAYFENMPGDLYLLCSDGLIKEVSHNEITDILRLGKSSEITQKLIDLSLERGARDNVTVIVIESEKEPLDSTN